MKNQLCAGLGYSDCLTHIWTTASMCVHAAPRWGGRFLRCRGVSLLFLCLGKSNPYCEISMGSQSYTTRTLQDTLNPKWNFNCQFFIKDLYQDVLCITMFDRDQFSPDGKTVLGKEGFFVTWGMQFLTSSSKSLIASCEMLCKNTSLLKRFSSPPEPTAPGSQV